MATKKGTPLSARDALAAVRQAAMALTEDLKSARQQRQALEDELNGLLNKPLSKVALIQFLERRTDAAAAFFARSFANEVVPGNNVLERQAQPGRLTQLVLADVPVLLGNAAIREPDAGRMSVSILRGFAQWLGVNHFAFSYFFRDVLKAKLPELMEGVTLPYPDDGKNLEEREAEVADLLSKIDEAEQRIAGIQAELAELDDVLPREPEVVPPATGTEGRLGVRPRQRPSADES